MTSPKRTPVPKRIRYEILRRDNYKCRYCGAAAPEATLTVDHVIPVSLGGTNVPGNLVAACVDCNAGKTSSSPDAAIVADVSESAIRFAAGQRAAIAQLEANAERQIAIGDRFLAHWNRWVDGRDEPNPLPAGWRSSIIRFAASGYEPDGPLCLRAIEKANNHLLANALHNGVWVRVNRRRPTSQWQPSRSRRLRILERDQNTCAYCGQNVDPLLATLDHVVPRSVGGTNDDINLVVACKRCNSSKNARTQVPVFSAIANYYIPASTNLFAIRNRAV